MTEIEREYKIMNVKNEMFMLDISYVIVGQFKLMWNKLVSTKIKIGTYSWFTARND